MQSYLGVTIHFLEDNTFVSGTLGVYELHSSHTSEYISQVFEEILLEWGINKSKIIAVVTDNGANIKKAAKETFGSRKFIPCFAHTISLIANNSIDNAAGLSVLVDKVRNIVKYVKHSVNVSDELRQYQKNDGIPEGNMLKMILDVKTRWNSLYYMVDRFLSLFKIISNILLDNPKAPDCLNTREGNTLSEIKDLLQPLEDLTKKISGDKYPIISCMLPLINCVKSAINQMTPDTAEGKSLQSNILIELNKYFKDLEIFNDIPICTLLDPRFKNLHFQDPIKCQNAIGKIKKLLMNYQNIQSVEPVTISEPSTSSSQSFDLWSYHTSVASIQMHNRTAPIDQELNDFLIKPVVDIKINPLEAWDIIKTVHPNLYEIAREKLSIIATSERLFSKTGQTKTYERNRLTGKRLKKLVFMSSLSKEDWFSIT